MIGLFRVQHHLVTLVQEDSTVVDDPVTFLGRLPFSFSLIKNLESAQALHHAG
jgi:hypothetical protein